MGTAPKKSRAARQLARRAADADVLASIEFLIFEDNGGSYHWSLQAGDGAILAQSGGFVSYDDAERAAQLVRGAAVSARFEPRAVEGGPIDLIARRGASNDDSNAESWLDERDGVGSEAVTELPGATPTPASEGTAIPHKPEVG
jgi:uncharacterized protein YegP (UPF0339 family)